MIRKINYLDERRSKRLLQSVSNKKHKLLFLLMMDCGLRVSETVNLQFKNFDFKKKTLSVYSLKKRGDEHVRVVPISDRCYEVLAEYVITLKDRNPDSYLFPSRDGKPITRKAVNKVCDRLKEKDPAFKDLHPHALRHTCATRLLETGAQLHEVKEILGHKNYDTTLVYAHIPQKVLRNRIEVMTASNDSFLQRIKTFFIPKKKPSLINISSKGSDFIVGRSSELQNVLDLLNKNVNTILLGSIGTGKSHILNAVTQGNKKILKFDDFSEIKKTLIAALIFLYKNDKKHVLELLYPEFDLAKTHQHLQKDSVVSLSKQLIKITQKHEYLIVIDSCDRITPRGIKVLEELKDHFTIFTTAREIPVNKSSFLWNFEIVRVENLSRHHALELVHKLSDDLDVEDFDLYRNHIYEQSDGNPRVIQELVDRYRKEIVISSDVVRTVRHTGSLKEYDFSLVVLLGLGSLAILRYLSSEVGNDSLRFIGGAAMVFLIISRYFFSFTKRRVI